MITRQVLSLLYLTPYSYILMSIICQSLYCQCTGWPKKKSFKKFRLSKSVFTLNNCKDDQKKNSFPVTKECISSKLIAMYE